MTRALDEIAPGWHLLENGIDTIQCWNSIKDNTSSTKSVSQLTTLDNY